MKSIQNCSCKISSIIRYINSEVIYKNHTVLLDTFNDSEIKIDDIEKCLLKHGFKGHLEVIEDSLYYKHMI